MQDIKYGNGARVRRATRRGLFPSDLFLDTNDYIDVSLVALFDFNFTTEIIENGCPANYCPAQTDSGTCEAQNPIDDTFPCVWNGGECGSDGFEQCYDHGVIGFYGECYARSGTGLFENFYDAYNIVNLTSEEECNEIITADAPGEGCMSFSLNPESNGGAIVGAFNVSTADLKTSLKESAELTETVRLRAGLEYK